MTEIQSFCITDTVSVKMCFPYSGRKSGDRQETSVGCFQQLEILKSKHDVIKRIHYTESSSATMQVAKRLILLFLIIVMDIFNDDNYKNIR